MPAADHVRMFLELRSAVGARAAIEYAVQQRILKLLARLGVPVTGRLMTLHLQSPAHPLYARHGSSDLDVFEQIFVDREYKPLDGIRGVRVIVDCGAYVGYSACYLLDAFPDARLIAVEPDESNFALLRRNLAPYGSRVTLLRAAIWSHKARLVVSKGQYRDGREWAIRVRDGQPGERASVDAIDIGTLLDEYSIESVDILKIDIEGAEVMAFASAPWLDRVRHITIELHGKDCEDVFFRSLQGYRYDLAHSGELTICTNILPLRDRSL
jgi:FkbM family methyltransferase